MAVAAILDAIGLEGGVLLVITAALAFYHLRTGITFLSRISTIVQIAGAFGILLAAAAAGLIPGVDLSIAIERLSAALGGVGTRLWDIVEVAI